MALLTARQDRQTESGGGVLTAHPHPGTLSPNNHQSEQAHFADAPQSQQVQRPFEWTSEHLGNSQSLQAAAASLGPPAAPRLGALEPLYTQAAGLVPCPASLSWQYTPRATCALTGHPSMPAHISAVVHACVGLLRSRCDAAGAGADRPGLGRARRDFLGMTSFPKAQAQQLWSTSGPKGPRRRLRRRVPGNTGRGAGDARCSRAQEQVQARATGGARLARWGIGGA